MVCAMDEDHAFYPPLLLLPRPPGDAPQHPENLLIFAAGNSGKGFDDTCTITSPALAKNVLAVGASTSGGTRISWTGDDGEVAQGTDRATGIDTVSFFSSRGFSLEGRVKPEVVAPGDLVRSDAGC